MQVKDIDLNSFTKILKTSGIRLNIGAFKLNVKIQNNSAIFDFYRMYNDYMLYDVDELIDFNITLKQPSNIRRFIYPQINFYFDEYSPFKPLPVSQAYAMFEWGLNWCISSHAHQYLILHAAVIEKNGKAIILPAPPSSGKSTLCSALVYRGWRLFSDELALISIKDGLLYPNTKPINLKNNSIDIIKSFAPDSIFSKTAIDTHKGTVALLKPPKSSVERMNEPNVATHVIFPKYIQNSKTNLSELGKAESFFKLIENSFNYNVLGKQGFNSMANLVEQVECLSFEYSNLNEAVDTFNRIVE